VQEMGSSGAGAVALYQSLSERECEVLRLLTEGLSNGQVAAKLVIAERTVKSHINNIPSKLQVVDRIQAAVYAWR